MFMQVRVLNAVCEGQCGLLPNADPCCGCRFLRLNVAEVGVSMMYWNSTFRAGMLTQARTQVHCGCRFRLVNVNNNLLLFHMLWPEVKMCCKKILLRILY